MQLPGAVALVRKIIAPPLRAPAFSTSIARVPYRLESDAPQSEVMRFPRGKEASMEAIAAEWRMRKARAVIAAVLR